VSVSQSVFLNRCDLPIGSELDRALGQAGFDVQLDLRGDEPRRGYWPVFFRGRGAGFEFTVSSLTEVELGPEVRTRAIGFDRIVTLTTRSGERDLHAAVIVASVLAFVSRGVLWSEESDTFFDGQEALDSARSWDVDVPDPPPAAPTIRYPRTIDLRLEVSERRRTAHSLVLEGGQQTFVVFLKTPPIAAGSRFVVVRVLERAAHVVTVLQLEASSRTICFSPTGLVLDPDLAPDFAALARKLGDTESVTGALLAGEREAARALTAFMVDPTAELERRALAVVILGLLGSFARDALHALRSVENHPRLGPEAKRAISRIEGQ
jgi:hypothetical protein